MKIKILFSCLLITAGAVIIAYPWLKALYFERQKNEIMEQWLSTNLVPEARQNPDSVEKIETDIVFKNREEDEDISFLSSADVPLNAEGILYIDSIDLISPILFDANEHNLNLSICRILGTAEAGDYGNYCLSGHKSRIYGRHFNRLHEVSAGDIIKVQVKDAEYFYIVSESFLVTKDDTWVLDSDPLKKEITLITCDYSTKETGRLIVKGVLLEE